MPSLDTSELAQRLRDATRVQPEGQDIERGGRLGYIHLFRKHMTKVKEAYCALVASPPLPEDQHHTNRFAD